MDVTFILSGITDFDAHIYTSMVVIIFDLYQEACYGFLSDSSVCGRFKTLIYNGIYSRSHLTLDSCFY